jgi:4-amino-4-deoxy-L-arabinose transferase-like glycosyltransferase
MNIILTKRPWIILAAVSLLVFLIGNELLPITDTAESNYAETAKEMVLSGNWISPQIYGQYWYDKPIFYYWEVALSFLVFGFNEFAARLPSALFGTANVLFIYWFGKKTISQRAGFTGALIFAFSIETFILSKSAVTDATLFLFLSAALGFFYLGYKEDKKYYYLCYIAAALAVLTKGPIGLILPGGAAFLFLLWKRNLKELLHVHLVSGLVLFFVITGLWYGTMCWLHGSDFLLNFIGVHNVLRATSPEHPSKDTWYFYIIIYLLGFAPWSIALLISAFKKWRHHTLSFAKTSDLNQLLLIYAGFVFLFFEIVATKYTTYTYPALFSLSLIAGELYAPVGKRVIHASVALTVLYSFLSLVVVPSIMLEHSGKEEGLAVSQIAGSSRPVVYFDNYRTSAVFYSSILIQRGEPKHLITSLKPDGISWKAKNVMPFIAIEKAMTDPNTVYIVNKSKEKTFRNTIPQEELSKYHRLQVTKTESIYYQ